jgi:hypothetical protein
MTERKPYQAPAIVHEQRYYIWRPETGRWHDSKTDATVEWHEWGDYRFSFDIRPDCSRFILCKPRKLPLPDGSIIDGPKLIGSGIIDREPGRGAAPIAVFDAPPAEELPWMLPFAIADKWAVMVARLRLSERS